MVSLQYTQDIASISYKLRYTRRSNFYFYYVGKKFSNIKIYVFNLKIGYSTFQTLLFCLRSCVLQVDAIFRIKCLRSLNIHNILVYLEHIKGSLNKMQ